MTDGIIQKIINSKIRRALDAQTTAKQMQDDINVQNYDYLIKTYKALEQELIEEIEKLKWHYCTNAGCVHAYSVEVKKLIGDTE